MDSKDRVQNFKKNEETEQILSLLEEKLKEVEQDLTVDKTTSPYPPIFIFGCARSGTTVLHQYLVQNVKCIYPSNFISRFYYAPYLGGLYYKLFTQLDERGELLGNRKGGSGFYTSDLGKTEGIHSPNEFWYFWRKHFKINEKGTVDRQAINEADIANFRNSIYALQNLFKGPFITKGLIVNDNIDLLEDIFPNPILLYIKRDLFDNAKSLYDARLHFFGTPDKWYSFYPRAKKIYKHMSPEEQVVKQVFDTNKVIEKSLSKCNKNRVIEVEYDSFCRNPAQLLNEIKQISSTVEIQLDLKPDSFEVSSRKEGNSEVDSKIKSAIQELT